MGGGYDYLHVEIYHPIIGMIILVLLFLQPFTQLLNAWLYRRHPKCRYPSPPATASASECSMVHISIVHIWFGRFLLLLAIINGGLGFAFADQIPYNTWSKAPRIVYGVVATVVVFTYVVVVVIWDKSEASQTSDTVRDEEMQGLSHQPLSRDQSGLGAGTETRPQTAQIAQTTQSGSTTGGVFKSSAL